MSRRCKSNSAAGNDVVNPTPGHLLWTLCAHR